MLVKMLLSPASFAARRISVRVTHVGVNVADTGEFALTNLNVAIVTPIWPPGVLHEVVWVSILGAKPDCKDGVVVIVSISTVW